MNAVLQILARFYPQAFKNTADPIAKPGQTITDFLQAGKHVDKTLAQSFFDALCISINNKFGIGTQEDASELLKLLFSKLDFPKATLICPGSNERTSQFNILELFWNKD